MEDAKQPEQLTTTEFTLKDAVTFHNNRMDAVHKLWSYLQAVALAFIAFAWTANRSVPTIIMAAIVFGVFASGNAILIFRARSDASQIARTIRHYTKRNRPSLNLEWFGRVILRPIRQVNIYRFIVLHIVLDLVTLVIILAPVLRCLCDWR